MFKSNRDQTCEAIKKLIYNNLDKNPLFDNLDLHQKLVLFLFLNSFKFEF